MIAATDRLRGLRILVVEDEGPVAMLIEDMLEDMGCTVAGSAASVGEALELIGRGGFDFALLDVNLAGEKVDPAAELLMRRGVPFAFATGYGAGGISQELRDRPVVQKPFSARELAALVCRALG
ncbi:MAG TPA: response regulator [Sphingomonas sp.]|nr:response regulator [Sphingomonas sp.]